MSSKNIVLKDDLAGLLEGLEQAKRESKDVVQKPKPKINNSDITNLFSDLEEASKEAKVLEKKRKDYVETTTEEISNLFKGLEEASKKTKTKISHNKIKPINNFLDSPLQANLIDVINRTTKMSNIDMAKLLGLSK